MLRVFHPDPWPAPGGKIVLSEVESSHLVRVRRARVGETVVVLNGVGRVAEGTVTLADEKSSQISIRNTANSPPPPVKVLAVGLPKGGTFGDIVRQAAELGATEIHPLLTERSEVHFTEVRLMHKLTRWRAAALEACKQSGNPWLPIISTPLELPAWLKQHFWESRDALRYVAALTPDAKPISAPSKPSGTRPYVVAIGPEGDFSASEYQLLERAAFIPIHLPGHVLRVETACVVALACLE